ncbi:hypothetical protein HDU97_009528 [Phlyctochytrium planicorne]|nr:hypothetical protein HDU97_009528 [Phlyctochytrium planicorne]
MSDSDDSLNGSTACCIETSILIVGAGPTGLCLAIELARRRIPHILIDSLTSRSPHSKAIALHARTMELFEQIDPMLADHLLRIGYTAPGFDFGLHCRSSSAPGSSGSDSLFFGAKAAGLAGLEDLDTRHPFVLVVPQFETEEALEVVYNRLGGRVWRGVKLLDMVHDEDGVSCSCSVISEQHSVPAEVMESFDGSNESSLKAPSPEIIPDIAVLMATEPGAEPEQAPPSDLGEITEPTHIINEQRTFFESPSTASSELINSSIIPSPALTESLPTRIPDDIPEIHIEPASPIKPQTPITNSATTTRTISIRCKYLCGSDGTRSQVRTLANIAYEGSPYPFTGMMTDCRLSQDYFVAGVAQFTSPHGVAWVIPFRNGLHRVITMTWPTRERPRPKSTIDVLENWRKQREKKEWDSEDGIGNRAEREHEHSWIPFADDAHPEITMAPVTIDDMQQTLNKILDPNNEGRPPTTLLHPLWVTSWGAERRLAARYNDGRVFILGDAAHAHGPVGGQGMNTGIQDAINLAWKLANVLDGSSPERILMTYQNERQFVASKVNEVCDGLLWSMMFGRFSLARWLREWAVEFAVTLPFVRAFFVGLLSGIGISYRSVWKDAFPWLPASNGHCTWKGKKRKQSWFGLGTVAEKVMDGMKSAAGAAMGVSLHAILSIWAGRIPFVSTSNSPLPVPIFLPTLPSSISSIQIGDRVPDAELTALDPLGHSRIPTLDRFGTGTVFSPRTRLHAFFSASTGFKFLLLLDHAMLAGSGQAFLGTGVDPEGGQSGAHKSGQKTNPGETKSGLLNSIRYIANRLSTLKSPPSMAIILDHGVIKDYGLSNSQLRHQSSANLFQSTDALLTSSFPHQHLHTSDNSSGLFDPPSPTASTASPMRGAGRSLYVSRFVDIRGEARRKMGLTHGSMVLVRPDGYVAYVGSLSDDWQRSLDVGMLPWLLG